MKGERVAVFIPCLVDQVYPEMGFAMVDVLEHLGYEVTYDPRQTCCGQPAFNAGHREEARSVADVFLDVFASEETIVCPSGSCAAMAREFFPALYRGEPREAQARAVGGRVREFSEFLVGEGKTSAIRGEYRGRVGFHNSCHSYRELRIDRQPLELLERIEGCEITAPEGEPVCCGFGGLFSVKFESIASAMAASRVDQFVGIGVDAIVSNDPGCIMHMRQECEARSIDLRIEHLAEFLSCAMGLRERAAQRGRTR